MELVPYERPRGEIHDLAHLDTLSDGRCLLLCVSARTLYLLQNFVARDVAFAARYAVELLDEGYIPVTPDHEEWPLFLEVVNAARLEVEDMSCDIQTGLESIADALSDLEINVTCGGGGASSGGGTVVEPCIGGLPNEDLLPPDDQSQGNPSEDPPPEGFNTWEEYFTYKCNAAAFIHDFVRRYMVACAGFDLAFLAANVVAPVIAGITGILPAALTPAGFAVMVTSLVAIGVLTLGSWFFMQQMIDQWDLDKDDIICALYNSGTSVEAVSAVANAIEDAIQAIIAWGLLEPIAGQIAELLAEAFGTLAGNGLVEPLFKAVVAVTAYEHDCSGCEQSAANLFLTQLFNPYNVLVLGDEITSLAESAEYGYQTQNTGVELYCYFTSPGSIAEWDWGVYVGAPDHPGETMQFNFFLEHWTGSEWSKVYESLNHEFDADLWTYFGEDHIAVPLVDGDEYRMQFDIWNFNYYGWFRAIRAKSSDF